MSDEFIEIATKEINEEISELDKLLSTCQNDANIFSSADKFQKHTHKIRGLAPMMGKEELGNFSAILDSVLKKMMIMKVGCYYQYIQLKPYMGIGLMI